MFKSIAPVFFRAFYGKIASPFFHVKSKKRRFADGWATENEVRIAKTAITKGSATVVKGTGNCLVIGEGAKFSGSVAVSGNGNRVAIGDNCNFRGDILVRGDYQTVSFGDHSTSAGIYILCQENRNVLIGKWCMFSREIEIRTTDAHSVVDRDTGQRLNSPGDVIVGDHVWVGVGSILNKGSIVPSDSIVGAMSFVNRGFEEEGIILAGTPAQIVKRNITWNRSRKASFPLDELYHWKAED
ncbi:hypothetical protein [Rhizobium sp. OAE497]|uniref:acyltransferase n=1 Tax=Rhizobium sp. OAE497 TaxID=2663796 RepID=UPI0018F51DF4